MRLLSPLAVTLLLLSLTDVRLAALSVSKPPREPRHPREDFLQQQITARCPSGFSLAPACPCSEAEVALPTPRDPVTSRSAYVSGFSLSVCSGRNSTS